MEPYHVPIEVVGYREEWPALFAAERNRLLEHLGEHVVAVEHVGSTSVPGLAAKPIVDLCPVVPDMEAAYACRPTMLDLGYQFNAERENWLAFERLDDDGQQYNVHFHVQGTERLERVLLLREYLRDHEHARSVYASIKRLAAAAHPDDPSAYNDRKDDVVECLLTAAREAGHEERVEYA